MKSHDQNVVKNDAVPDAKSVPKIQTRKKSGDHVKNMATTAAVSTHRHRNKKHFPVVEYRVPKSREYNTAKLALLNKIHPCKLEEVHSYAQSNEHPLCAAMRSIGEAYVLSEAINTLSDHKIDEAWILDVGGAGKRHMSLQRKYVWSCIPTQSAKDTLRRFVIPPGQHCEHNWSQCNCHDFPISVSVHSLYYIHPAEIFSKLLSQKVPVHFALIHVYEDDSGELMNGEMEYVKQDGTLYVKAAGNIHHYVHPAMDWLKDGSMTFPNGTLVWERMRTFLDSEVIRFHATPIIAQEKLRMPTVVAKLAPVIDEKFELKKFTEVVNLCALPHKEINAANHAKFLESVRRKGVAERLDIKRLIAFASKEYLSQEVYLAETTNDIQLVAYERKLRSNMIRREDMTIYIVLAGIIVPLLLIFAPKLSLIPAFAVEYWQEIAFTVAWLVFVYLLINGHFARFRKFDGGLPRLSLFSHFRKWKIKAKVTDFCCALVDKETDKDKLLSLTLPRDYYEPCSGKDAAYAMVYSPAHPPYFPRKCGHNAVSSIKNKLGQKIPGAGKYHHDLHPVLRDVALKASAVLKPLGWEEWVSRFPGPKQERLRREAKENEDEVISTWNDSKFFTKFEAYPEPKYPRPIISSSVELNFNIGRWLIPLTEFLSENLPPQFLFPLHGDTEQIGAHHSRNSGFMAMDSDFSSFDSSQTAKALELVFTFFELANIPKYVVDRCRQDNSLCVIRTRTGMKAVMKSCRFSGRSETLIGNTIITTNTALQTFASDLQALLVKGDDMVLYLTPKYYDVDGLKDSFLEHGLVAKLRLIDDYEAEFCSSIFVPSVYDSVLVVKPGKLLAKTFWCKNLDYTHEEMEQQFASILKGLANTLRNLPGLKGLYRNPVYVKWQGKVEAHYDEYNEYSRNEIQYGEEAVTFLCERYDVTRAELEELEEELSSSFPVRLNSLASRKLIEKDWSESNDAEHLIETTECDDQYDLCAPFFEESLRYAAPLPVTLFLSLTEFLLTGQVYNLIGHWVLCFVLIKFGFAWSLLLHCINNCLAEAKQLSFYMATKRSKRKGKRARPRRPRAQVANRQIAHLARMISDPCGSPLYSGLYGESAGMLSKLKTVHAFSDNQTFGFFLWCPAGVSNVKGTKTFINNSYFVAANGTTAPLNTVDSPWGASLPTTGGAAGNLGGNSFVVGTTVSDFRTLSACLKLSYVGNTSDCKGRIASFANIPTGLLLNGQAGGPVDVNKLFSYAEHVQRTSLDPMEVKWRPAPSYSQFFKNDIDAPMLREVGNATGRASDSQRFGETWCGFAWAGIPASDLVIEAYHNLEWRPEGDQGFVGQTVETTGTPETVLKIVEALDKQHPGWVYRAYQEWASPAARIANMALAGYGAAEGGNRVMRRLQAP